MDQLNIELVEGCRKGNPKAQEKLYKAFYRYAMVICMKYAKDSDDAIEILNDGFLKVFNGIGKFNQENSLKAWIGRIMVNTAIDHYRKSRNALPTCDLEVALTESSDRTVLDDFAGEELLKLVRQLPPSYRMVFNLYVIEGFAHKEIAEQLEITEGTSRAHLAAANAKLREMIKKKELNEDFFLKK